MRRRRLRPQSGGMELSLADVLTTALGCVLLLFLAAVLLIKHTLHDEKVHHALTQAELEAQTEGRAAAELARRRALGQRSAVEQALDAERAAHAADRRKVEELERRLEGISGDLSAAQAAQAEATQQYRGLRDAARTAVQELDPRTASPVDVVMVVDGTQSMAPSLDATRRNLIGTVKALRVVSPTVRVGVVVFRDRREAANVRLEAHPLTDNERALAKFLQGIEAKSTGVDTDRPEWLCGGIKAATEADWRHEAIKLMIVVSDAGAQSRPKRCIDAVEEFTTRAGRVYMLSNEPPGYRTKAALRAEYEKKVLPLHARIAAAGGGVHVKGADADALLTEVLRAAFTSRTATPLEALKNVVEASPEAPEAQGAGPSEPEPAAPASQE